MMTYFRGAHTAHRLKNKDLQTVSSKASRALHSKVVQRFQSVLPKDIAHVIIGKHQLP